MKDALGSYFNLTLLFVFILIVSGFISLAINYTKAYRVKNNVLTYLEKYEGNANNQELLDKVQSYIKSVGYTFNQESISKAQQMGYTCPEYNGGKEGWCYKSNRASTKYGSTFNVDIVVFVNLHIPVINRIFSSLDFFWMRGTTSSIPVLE